PPQDHHRADGQSETIAHLLQCSVGHPLVLHQWTQDAAPQDAAPQDPAPQDAAPQDAIGWIVLFGGCMTDSIMSKAATMEIPINSNGDTRTLGEDDGLEQARKVQWGLDEKVGRPPGQRVRRALVEGLGPTAAPCVSVFVCDGLAWSDSEWQRVIFSGESRFSLGGDAQRIRVWRHRGQHRDERFVVARPEDLVSLHLQPYRTTCRNCVRMFKLHGMDYHRTPLGTSTAPYRDVWRVGLANTAARRHTERQTSDLQQVMVSGPNLNETSIVSGGYGGTAEGIIPTSSIKGSGIHHSSSSSMMADEASRGVAVEKFDMMKKWGMNTYKCTKQLISERFGRGSRTVDLELEAQIEVLRDTKRKYENVLRLARALTNHFYSMVQTQHALGDTFADLSQKSPELRDEFGYNAETQKLLCKNGETLLGAINFFVSSINTLVNKTMEDTLMTIKMYENARLEFDAYRADLEELNMGPRDAVTMARIEAAQQQYQIHKDKYERLRSDVTIKLKFLEENKVKVMHKQLLLFHNAISAYFAGNQQQLEQTLKQFNIKLKPPGADKPSWLEEQ
ncbi:hypothetical protein NFI96_017389, partial [Prochilodus magdalenae]